MKLIVNFERKESRLTRSGHWLDCKEDTRQLVRYAQTPEDTDGVTGLRVYGGTR
jgi:hypothetical protein